MSAAFDPYHKWLGIPPAEQPPNLYRLLAIPLFEADADVIDAAADGRMTHLRTFSAGKNAPLAQKLLNEIASARVTLLNPQARAGYDAQLQGQLASLEAARLHAQQAAAPPPPVMLPPGMEQPIGGAVYGGYQPAPAAPAFDIDAGPYTGRASRGTPLLMIALVGCFAVVAAIGGLWYVMRGMQGGETIVDNPVDPPPVPNDIATPTPPGSTGPATVDDGANDPPSAAPETPITNDPPPSDDSKTPPITPPPTPPNPPSTPPESPNNSEVTPQAGPEVFELKGHNGPVLSVDFSADTRFAVTGGEDRTVRVWDVQRKQAIRLFEGMPSAVRCVRISGDGNYIAIACPEPDRLLRVWHVNRPTEAVDMRLDRNIESFEFSTDGSTLIAGAEGYVQIFHARSGTSRGKYDFNGNSTAVTSDGRGFAAAGPGHLIRVFEAGGEPRTMSSGRGIVGGVAISGDNQVLLSGAADRVLRLWDLRTGMEIVLLRAPGRVRSVTINHDGRRCASLGERFVSVWDLSERKQIFSQLQTGDCAPAISGDGRLLMMGDADGTVRLVPLPPLPSTPLPSVPRQPMEAGEGNTSPFGGSDLTQPRPRVKAPPPEAAEIAAATEQLQEIYPKTESKAPEEQLQLAERLVQLVATTEQPAEQYALLQFAATLAQRGGDGRMAVRALDELASWFTVDVLPMKASQLTLMAKGAKDESIADSLVCASLPVAEAAATAGHMEAASDLIDAVANVCSKPWGRRHVKLVAEARADLAKAKKPWAAAQLAKTKLEADPENAEASTALGIWTALETGDWSTGLPLLAQGSDAKLKVLAESDLAAEKGGPPDQLKAADAWYEAAQATGETHKAAMLQRAGHWYSAVLPMVKQQIARLKIEGRLEEIAAAPASGPSQGAGGELKAGKPLHVLGLVDLRSDALGGAEWTRKREAIGIEQPQFDSRFMLPVQLDGSYEFEFDFTAPQGQVVAWLPVGEHGVQLWIAEGQRTPISGLAFIGGLQPDRNPTRTLMPNLDWTKRHTVAVRVEQTGELASIEATFDGKPLVRYRGPSEALSGELRNSIRDTKRLALGTMNGPVMFHTAKVKLLEGDGKLVTPPGFQ